MFKISAILLLGAAAKETYSERLNLWPLPNNFNLLEFQFEFNISKEMGTAKSPFSVDYFPI